MKKCDKSCLCRKLTSLLRYSVFFQLRKSTQNVVGSQILPCQYSHHRIYLSCGQNQRLVILYIQQNILCLYISKVSYVFSSRSRIPSCQSISNRWISRTHPRVGACDPMIGDGLDPPFTGADPSRFFSSYVLLCSENKCITR